MVKDKSLKVKPPAGSGQGQKEEKKMSVRFRPIDAKVQGPGFVERIGRDGGYRSSRFLKAGQTLVPSQIPASMSPVSLPKVEAVIASRAPEISEPEMIELQSQSYNVMKDELIVGIFREFMKKKGYKIEGSNKSYIEAFLEKADDNEEMKYLNDEDTDQFIKWYNKEHNRSFRLPTEKEWLAAVAEAGDQLRGNLWERMSNIENGRVVLRCRLLAFRVGHLPALRSDYFAARFVEDKPQK